MSEDILSKLKALHGDVQARIEASSDFKAMKAVERAIGELAAAIAPAEEPVAASEAVENAEATAEAAPAEAEAEVVAAAEADAAEPAAAEEAVSDAAPAAEEPAAAEAEASADAAAESTELLQLKLLRRLQRNLPQQMRLLRKKQLPKPLRPRPLQRRLLRQKPRLQRLQKLPRRQRPPRRNLLLRLQKRKPKRALQLNLLLPPKFRQKSKHSLRKSSPTDTQPQNHQLPLRRPDTNRFTLKRLAEAHGKPRKIWAFLIPGPTITYCVRGFAPRRYVLN